MSLNYMFYPITLSYATTNVNTNDKYNTGTPQVVTVTADDGYYFETTPIIRSSDANGSQFTHKMQSDESGDYKTSFYLVIDDEFANQYMNIYLSSNTLRLTANAVMMPKIEKYGIINIYNPTPSELKAIGEVRYTHFDGENTQVIDLGNYISSLIKVFVKIPKASTTEVNLGGYKTGVVCNVVENDVVETNCGTVEIVGKYHNSMDYENTTVEIYLPLIGFQTLETDKVMNETISLIYRTNVINGDTIACIYNTTGTLLYTFTCRASFEIPYRLNVTDTQGAISVSSDYLFGFTPTVTIRYNKAYNASAVVGSDNRETRLSNVQGYVKCSEVFNTINATTAEKDEIDDLLKTGVIIT